MTTASSTEGLLQDAMVSSPAKAAWPPLGKTAGLELALLVALWIVERPYPGIVHDGRLYIAQALHNLNPAQYADDLYFKYGSQDAFSAFSLLYTPIVAALGAPMAHFVISVAGEVLWLVSLIWLVAKLFPNRRTRIFATIAAISLSAHYGGDLIFRYAEPFATPRIFAEALVLMALANALGGRFVLTILLLFAAAALHPIMAATGAGLITVRAAVADRRVWLAALPMTAAISILALLHVGPFGRLLLQFDDEWFRIVKVRCNFAFLTRWDWTDFLGLASSATILSVAYAVGPKEERRQTIAVGMAGALAVFATLVGVDLGRNILFANAQPWRELWLVSLWVNICAVLIASRVPATYTSRELFVAYLGFSAGSVFFPVLNFVVSSAGLAAALAFFLERRGPLPRPLRFAMLAVPALGLWLTVYLLLTHETWSDAFWDTSRAAVAVLAVVTMFAIPKLSGGWRLPAAACTLLVAALMLGDARQPWAKFIDSSVNNTGLRAFVGTGRNIYWEGDDGMELLWVKLGKPSYYSCLQGTGVMFYRPTAVEYQRRTRVFQALRTRTFSQRPNAACPADPATPGWGPTSIAELADACRRLPELDTIILAHRIPGGEIAHWRSPLPTAFYESDGEAVYDRDFYRYDCAPLREVPGGHGT